MLIATSSMRLISIQMVDISCQVVMTQLSKYGISDKDTSFLLSMVMKANQPQLPTLHAVTTSQLVVQTQL